MIISLLSVLGLGLSAYAIWVDHRAANYKPACDISDHISCTKAFHSPYGKLFGLKNSVYGVGFYTALLTLSFFDNQQAIFLLSILAFLGSVVLAYLSYIKMQNFCVVCTAIYCTNIALLITSWLAL